MNKTFTVHAAPIGKGRPRVTRFGTYTPEKTRLYERFVQKEYAAQCESYRFPSGAPLSLHIVAFCSIPTSYSKKKRAALRGYPHTKKPDIDNMAKAIMDALNGVAWEDDAGIAQLHVSKVYADGAPYSVVSVSELEDLTDANVSE